MSGRTQRRNNNRQGGGGGEGGGGRNKNNNEEAGLTDEQRVRRNFAFALASAIEDDQKRRWRAANPDAAAGESDEEDGINETDHQIVNAEDGPVGRYFFELVTNVQSGLPELRTWNYTPMAQPTIEELVPYVDPQVMKRRLRKSQRRGKRAIEVSRVRVRRKNMETVTRLFKHQGKWSNVLKMKRNGVDPKMLVVPFVTFKGKRFALKAYPIEEGELDELDGDEEE